MKNIETSIAERKEEKQTYKRVFVEVGTHMGPVPYMGNRKFSDNELYIGIEKDEKRIGVAKKSATRKHKNDNVENLYFLQADANHLPLKNNVAEELFLGNVLGDPGISQEDKENFLEEAKRVVRKEGVIIIKETNTPLDRTILSKLIDRHGFSIVKEIKRESLDWGDAVDYYQRRLSIPVMDSIESYIVYFKKEKKEE